MPPLPPTPPHLLDLTVAEMAARVGDPRDRLRAGDLVDASLSRIAALDGRVKAFLHVSAELARRQAADVDARVARGERVGPLAGVPLAVKDNLAVAGLPLTCASRMLGAYRPARDATVVARAVAAGACVVGKTNLDEFAMGSSTENSAFGPSRNPYDLERVPGGSSGGSAAAVAAGMVPIAFGSETGGSVRQPAALCGIVGHKPTYGRVSRSGLVAFASSLDQVGPLARSTEDAAALQAAVEGPDPADATTRSLPALLGAPLDLAGLRVGIVEELEGGGDGFDPEVAAAVARAREALAQRGARLVRQSLPLVRAGIPVYYLVATAEASSNLARFDGIRYGHRSKAARGVEETYRKSRSEGFGPEVKRRILLGTFVLSAGYYDAYYAQGMRVRRLIRDNTLKAFERYDLVMTPTCPTTAFTHGAISDPVAMYLQDIFTVQANLAGIPAISVPTGTHSNGLPFGTQLMAKPFDDERLIAWAGKLF